MERINARIDDGLCFENHTIRGKAKMTARVGLYLPVMMVLALGSVKAQENAPCKAAKHPKTSPNSPRNHPIAVRKPRSPPRRTGFSKPKSAKNPQKKDSARLSGTAAV